MSASINRDDKDRWKYWLLFTEDRDGEMLFYHAVGFAEEPDDHNIQLAVEEVRDDEEFGLGEKVYDLDVRVIPPGEAAETLKEYLRSQDIEMV